MSLPALGPVGDSAVEIVLSSGTPPEMIAAARAIADAIDAAGHPEVIDVVPAIDRVLVVYDPVRGGDLGGLQDRLAASAATARRCDAHGTRHEIPVCYGGPHGPDLEEVCTLHALDRHDVVRLHTAPDYLVQAIGFVPGFAYLHGLPEPLVTPRRTTPRARVAAGSVGIGGAQTGVYPFATPGGWNVIGRSPAVLFDVARRPAARLRAGDSVRFVAIDAGDCAAEFARRETAAAGSAAPAPAPGLIVAEAGLWTSIQDLGRPGQRAAGLPLSGAVDAPALRLANLLVGNHEAAAGIEFTLVGPTLVFERDAVVAVAGGEFTGLPRGRPVRIGAGTELALGQARSGCRGVLAVAGGIAVPRVLGSASTYEPAALGGLSGRRLAAGDRLPVGDPRHGVGIDPVVAAAVVPDPPHPCTLRIIPAAEAGPGLDALWRHAWRTSARSDRMGVRFDGQPLPPHAVPDRGRFVSRPVLPGAVQLPPDGRPILLLADAQTMGGYPVIGHVVAADLRLAAQLRPGHEVRWRRSTLEEAHAAARALAAAIAGASCGDRVARSEA